MIFNDWDISELRACTPFLYTPPPKCHKAFKGATVGLLKRTMASLSHLIFRSTRLPCCICEERPATVLECDKGLIDNLKGNTLSCGSGRHVTRKSPLNMFKQRTFLQIPVWIRNKVINRSYSKQRSNSPVRVGWSVLPCVIYIYEPNFNASGFLCRSREVTNLLYILASLYLSGRILLF